MPSKKLKKTTKPLDTHLFAYVQRSNANYARKQGKAKFGSFSAYVNALIAKDRGVKPKVSARV